VPEVLWNVLAGIGGGGAVAAGLSRWLGGIWAERILTREKAQLDRDLLRVETELQSVRDRASWLHAREDALAADFSKAFEGFMVPTLSALHSICWLTWAATEAPAEITPARLEAYDREMHERLPLVSSRLALLAAHDASAYGRLRGHARAIYAMDAEVAKTARVLVDPGADATRREQATAQLRGLLGACQKLEEQIPDDVADLLQQIRDARSARPR